MSGLNSAFIDFVNKYRFKPVEFVQDVFRAQPDQWQAEFLKAIFVNAERRLRTTGGTAGATSGVIRGCSATRLTSSVED